MNSEIESSLIGRLRICVKLAGSGNILSQKLGISRNTLENYLTNQSEPRLSTLQQIADLVGVRLAWLAAGDGHQFEGAEPVPSQTLAMIDPELMGKINDVISRTYKDIGGRISPADTGRMAAKWYSFMVDVGSDPVARTAALTVLATQLKAELSAPISIEDNSKRRA